MTEPAGKPVFQEIWQYQGKPLRMMQADPAHKGVVCFSVDGNLTFLDAKGKEVWKNQIGTDIRSISLAETLEILAVNEAGHIILINPQGETIWKKRLFHALFGVISANGLFMTFVTRDPTVVLLDRNCRPKWTYRNLLKVPATLGISAEGNTVSFACQDDRGEGLASVGINGKPYDAFMGVDPVIALSLNSAGDVVVLLDKGKGIYCINCVKACGIWKGTLSSHFDGVSLADQSRHVLLFSKTGLLSVLDDKGNPFWEHRFPFNLLDARLSADGQTIWYASPEGRVGGMVSRAGRDMSRMEFVDFDPPQLADEVTSSFKRIWSVELPAPVVGEKPRVRRWRGQDQVEYLLLWDGSERLICLNDVGEEIWANRMTMRGISDMAVSPSADLAVLLASGVVLGFHLDGSEAFKFFGNFTGVHVFASGAFLLLGANGQVRFYLNHNHYSHIVEAGEPILAFRGDEEHSFLVGKKRAVSVGSDGKIVGTREVEGDIISCRLESSEGELMIGTSHGDLVFLKKDGEVGYHHKLSSPVGLVCVQKSEDVVFAGISEAKDVVVLQNRSNRKTKTSLNGVLKYATGHEKGAVFSTAVDEIALIGLSGEILARYMFPDRIVELLSSRKGQFLYVLSEGTFGKYCTSEAVSAGKSPLQFVEI